jgi:hypothetical protein
MHTVFYEVEKSAHVHSSGTYFEQLIQLLQEGAPIPYTTHACGHLFLTPNVEQPGVADGNPIFWRVQTNAKEYVGKTPDELAKPFVEKLLQQRAEAAPYTGPTTLYGIFDQDSHTNAWEFTGILAGRERVAKQIQAELAKGRWDTFEVRPIRVFATLEDYQKNKPSR